MAAYRATSGRQHSALTHGHAAGSVGRVTVVRQVPILWAGLLLLLGPAYIASKPLAWLITWSVPGCVPSPLRDSSKVR